MKNFVSHFLDLLLIYACISFIFLNINFMEWNYLGRIIMAAFMLVAIFGDDDDEIIELQHGENYEQK